jgi:hypothetical protein
MQFDSTECPRFEGIVTSRPGHCFSSGCASQGWLALECAVPVSVWNAVKREMDDDGRKIFQERHQHLKKMAHKTIENIC